MPKLAELADILFSDGSNSLEHHTDCTVTWKNSVIEQTASGVSGRYRKPDHDDMEVSITSNIIESGDMEGFEDVALSIEAADCIFLSGISVGIKNDIVESTLKGANFPLRAYGHTDVDVSIDSQVLFTATITPGTYTVDHAYHNKIADAVENKTALAVIITSTYCVISGSFFVSEISNDGKDGDFVGTSYKLVPNGAVTLTAGAPDDTWMSAMIGAYIGKAELTCTITTPTYLAEGQFLVSEIPFSAKDGSFNDGKFTLVPNGDVTITPFAVTSA
ncbi:MAG: hypothetical protein WC748_09985 [Legionellales bacterium]|jgi:hypothetical protein